VKDLSGHCLQDSVMEQPPVLLPTDNLSAKLDGTLPFEASLPLDCFVTTNSSAIAITWRAYKRDFLRRDGRFNDALII